MFRMNEFIRIEIIPIMIKQDIKKGDNIAELIVQSIREKNESLQENDVVVITHKIVSKAEGKIVDLGNVVPSEESKKIASNTRKDPRLIELIISQANEIVKIDKDIIITETKHGFVCANAGVDHSNVPGDDLVTLLPRDPDGSAEKLAAALRKITGKRIAVIITDTFGRPWRLGLTNVAIGASGLPVLVDLRGTRDRDGKPLTATVLAVADELAAAAGLLMGKAEGTPAVLIRGYRFKPASEKAAGIVRPASEDLFR